MKTTIALVAAFVTLLFAASAGAATMRLTPAKVRPGALVTAVGSGFPASRAGAITVRGRFVAGLRTNSAGAFRKRFRVPRLGAGPAGVVASVFGRRVPSALIIGRRTLSSSMTALSTGQRVFVAPVVGVTGAVVGVSGAGFPRGALVKILYDGSQRGLPVQTRVARGGRATFAMRFRVPATKSGANILTVQVGARALMRIPVGVRACNPVCLPYVADFTFDHSGIKDKNGIGTGFTNVIPSSRYKPANLNMTTAAPGTLAITATRGIAIGTTNDQDNMLGVRVPGGPLAISTMLLNVPATTHADEQAGIWFGKDQDTYAKLVVWSPPSNAGNDKVELLWDVVGHRPRGVSVIGSFTGNSISIGLRMIVDPASGQLTAYYSVNGSAYQQVDGAAPTAPPALFGPQAVYAGIFASSRNRAGGQPPLVYTFDSFSVARTTPPAGPTPGTDGTWTTRAAMPQAVLDAGSAELGGKLYMVAGKIAGSPAPHIATLHIYNPVSNSWSTGADLPYGGVENPAVVGYNGKLYAFGGSTAAFSGAVENAAVYDPGSNTWSPLPSMKYTASDGVTVVPVRRSGAVAEVIGNKIYVAGGMDENGMAKGTVLEFDPSSETWLRKKDMNDARDNPGGASFTVGGNDYLYVFGGRLNVAQPSVNTVERFDPSSNTWTDVSSMLTGRRSMAVSILNNKIIVMGGEGEAAGAKVVFGANEEYDPVADTWRSLKPMPTPRHGAGAGSIGGTIYVAGGSPKAGKGFTAVNEAFTLP